jgi:hypothetical protein
MSKILWAINDRHLGVPGLTLSRRLISRRCDLGPRHLQAERYFRPRRLRANLPKKQSGWLM